MDFRRVVYTKMSPAKVKENRRFFKNHVKRAFVRWLAYEGLLDEVLDKRDMKIAKTKGCLPEYLDVHHMLPLSGADDPLVNNFSNLCVLHKEVHKQINKEIFQPQLQDMYNMPYGFQQVIDIPLFPPVDVEGIKKYLDKSKKYGIILPKERGW